MSIIDFFSNYPDLSENTKNAIINRIKLKKGRKNEILLSAGEICENIYLLEAGFARGYNLKDGNTFTSWFACENDIITSMFSFLSQKPGFEYIELLEDSILYYLPHADLENLYASHTDLNFVGRKLVEKYFLELEEKANALQYLSAKERYQKLLDERPDLLLRASVGHIASYLGMSIETLSRIRGKI